VLFQVTTSDSPNAKDASCGLVVVSFRRLAKVGSLTYTSAAATANPAQRRQPIRPSSRRARAGFAHCVSCVLRARRDVEKEYGAIHVVLRGEDNARTVGGPTQLSRRVSNCGLDRSRVCLGCTSYVTRDVFLSERGYIPSALGFHVSINAPRPTSFPSVGPRRRALDRHARGNGDTLGRGIGKP
jgi:hypothetical protein